MKCGIIRDLLPNYIDKLTGEDSNAEIEKHLAVCADCKKYYQDMRGKTWTEKESSEEKQKEINVLKSFRRMRRRWIAAVCAAGAGVAIAVCVCIWCYSPMPYEETKVKIQVYDGEPKLSEEGFPVLDEDGEPSELAGIQVRSVAGGKKTEYVQMTDKEVTVDGSAKHLVFVSNKNSIGWQLRFGGVNEKDDNANIIGYYSGYLKDGTPLSEVSAVYYMDRGIDRIKEDTADEEVLELIEKYGHLLWERGSAQP